MKRYILSILFLTGVLFGASAQEVEVQEKGCQAYKDGHFIIKEKLLGKKYIIKRQGDTQVETDPDGTKFVFDVEWLDDCTYTLTLQDIYRNPNAIDWKEGQIITVKILETDDKGYTQESTSNLDELTFVKDMVMISEKAYNRKVKFSQKNEGLTLNNN